MKFPRNLFIKSRGFIHAYPQCLVGAFVDAPVIGQIKEVRTHVTGPFSLTVRSPRGETTVLGPMGLRVARASARVRGFMNDAFQTNPYALLGMRVQLTTLKAPVTIVGFANGLHTVRLGDGVTQDVNLGGQCLRLLDLGEAPRGMSADDETESESESESESEYETESESEEDEPVIVEDQGKAPVKVGPKEATERMQAMLKASLVMATAIRAASSEEEEEPVVAVTGKKRRTADPAPEEDDEGRPAAAVQRVPDRVEEPPAKVVRLTRDTPEGELVWQVPLAGMTVAHLWDIVKLSTGGTAFTVADTLPYPRERRLDTIPPRGGVVHLKIGAPRATPNTTERLLIRAMTYTFWLDVKAHDRIGDVKVAALKHLTIDTVGGVSVWSASSTDLGDDAIVEDVIATHRARLLHLICKTVNVQFAAHVDELQKARVDKLGRMLRDVRTCQDERERAKLMCAYVDQMDALEAERVVETKANPDLRFTFSMRNVVEQDKGGAAFTTANQNTLAWSVKKHFLEKYVPSEFSDPTRCRLVVGGRLVSDTTTLYQAFDPVYAKEVLVVID